MPHVPRPLRQVALLVALACCAALATVSPAGATRAPLAESSAIALPLAGKVIAIDPGHQLGSFLHLRQINRLVWVGFWKPCNTTGTATNGGFPEATFT